MKDIQLADITQTGDVERSRYMLLHSQNIRANTMIATFVMVSAPRLSVVVHGHLIALNHSPSPFPRAIVATPCNRFAYIPYKL